MSNTALKAFTGRDEVPHRLGMSYPLQKLSQLELDIIITSSMLSLFCYYCYL